MSDAIVESSHYIAHIVLNMFKCKFDVQLQFSPRWSFATAQVTKAQQSKKTGGLEYTSSHMLDAVLLSDKVKSLDEMGQVVSEFFSTHSHIVTSFFGFNSMFQIPLNTYRTHGFLFQTSWASFSLDIWGLWAWFCMKSFASTFVPRHLYCTSKFNDCDFSFNQPKPKINAFLMTSADSAAVFDACFSVSSQSKPAWWLTVADVL